MLVVENLGGMGQSKLFMCLGKGRKGELYSRFL